MHAFVYGSLLLFAALARSQNLTMPAELTAGFTPATNLVLTFGANELVAGEVVSLAAARSPPTFALGDSDGINTGANYIIVCVDPDAGANAQVVHFLGTDFSPAPGRATNLTADAAPALEYRPPAPPEGTGPHRYVWLLYRQPRGFVARDVPTVRTAFDVDGWRRANGLADAIAGTFFVAEFGDGGVTSSSTASASSTTTARATTTAVGRTLTSPPTRATSEAAPTPTATGVVIGAAAGRDVSGRVLAAVAAVLAAAVAARLL